MKEKSNKKYAGQIEAQEKDGITKPGFKIFNDVVNFTLKGEALENLTEIPEEKIIQLIENIKKEAKDTACVNIVVVIKFSIESIF